MGPGNHGANLHKLILASWVHESGTFYAKAAGGQALVLAGLTVSLGHYL